jgi:hypothetical protein
VSIHERLAQIASALQALGLRFLVLGGHAVRFYGIDRNTLDFDLHVSLPDLAALGDLLPRAHLFAGMPLAEAPSWRPRDFRRFIIGRLPDGREERLEFWGRNHLLPPFDQLFARRAEGHSGDQRIPFLSLPDLLRSKETERESDWQDIALLEEVQDERLLARASDRAGRVTALAALRSRTGFDRAAACGLADDPALLREALLAASAPVTSAMLLPFLPEPWPELQMPAQTWALLAGPLRHVRAGSPRHLALVEVSRRAYKLAAMAADRRDKLAAANESQSRPAPGPVT